jgi:hypothetical protein
LRRHQDEVTAKVAKHAKISGLSIPVFFGALGELGGLYWSVSCRLLEVWL